MKVVQTFVFWVVCETALDGETIHYLQSSVRNDVGGFVSMTLDILSARRFATKQDAESNLRLIQSSIPDETGLTIRKVGLVVSFLEG